MTIYEGYEKKKTYISEEDVKKLLQYIDSIQYGSVTLFIQEGKVVQIEKSEKIKLK
ncbi:MAG: YezD family protein [Clostridia bacterium]|nr:YezD family protein [Clostridia bacterium]